MDLLSFLDTLTTDFPLKYVKKNEIFIFSNSGRRGDVKSFCIPKDSIVSFLYTIKENNTSFPNVYNETAWRDCYSLFDDELVKSLITVQTRPLFETINKILTWASETQYTDGTMSLTIENIDKALAKLGERDLGSKNYINNFDQIIYYGVPGSGKSFAINNLINTKIPNKEERDEQIVRVVFHPEYSNADFVGQILPKYDEKQSKVDYFFNPGPFTKILKKAYANPELPFYLIIEEINRGNAAAIFGELFQLLDRSEDGMSSYSVNNDDINFEIRKDLPDLGWDENTGIRLPPNLSLLATMNTSDQNVFTLDNAFQRRWSMKLVENKFGNSDAENNQKESLIEKTDISWETFQTRINEEIGRLSAETGLSSMEDKRLGCWFVKNDNKLIKADSFAEKVLKYLWDDAFKFSREKIFNNTFGNLEDLAAEYKKNGFKNLFKEQLFNKERNNE